eukprot:c49047_g1_i1 orf=181-408(+)
MDIGMQMMNSIKTLAFALCTGIQNAQYDYKCRRSWVICICTQTEALAREKMEREVLNNVHMCVSSLGAMLTYACL